MSARDGMDVLVVGAGRMGTALGTLLARLGRRVTLYARREDLARVIDEEHRNPTYLRDVRLPDRLRATTDLAAAVVQTPLVVMAVPSQSFRDAARAVGDHLEGDQMVVHTTKGFEVESFNRMSQVLREETCTLKIGVLSGPTIPEELVAGHPTGAVVASAYTEVVEAVQELFKGGFFRVYGGRDVVGTEVAGAFKNVVSVAAGAVQGLKFGESTRWLLITRGLSEMTRLGAAMGADVLTFAGLAGIGDLAATCVSPHSRSHQLGRRVAAGESVDTVLADLHSIEALPTSDAISRHAARMGLELPIVRAVHGLLHEGWHVQRALAHLMSVPVGDELVAPRTR
jgi:glycerol-3-phosphate dehydrogenase (NAD(P)+)